jgi:hypothetical protein
MAQVRGTGQEAEPAKGDRSSRYWLHLAEVLDLFDNLNP